MNAMTHKKGQNEYPHLVCQQGFTLLEVMVALTILAVVAVAASQASRSYINSVDNIKTRTLAYYIAQNTLADLRIGHSWLTGVDTRQVDAEGRQWQVVITPQTTFLQTNQQNDDSAYLQPISIQVAPVVEGMVKNSIVSLDAVLSKPMEDNPS